MILPPSFIIRYIQSKHGDKWYSLIFSNLISDICRAMGITITSREAPKKPNPFIKCTTLETQDRARDKHGENVGRDQLR